MAGFSDDGQLQTDDSADWAMMQTRLESFRDFPRAKDVSAERLARAGFYFTGRSDQVRCFSCQKTVENWNKGDAPARRHHEASPECRYLSCTHRINSEPISNGSTYDEEAEAMEFRLRTGEVVDESTYPMMPHMKSEDDRFNTFTNWPPSAPVRPEDLAQAGLFYLGTSDRVQCFCCGGMLTGWEPGDNAWDEHSRHFPNCFFILGHDVGNVPSELPRQSRGMEAFENRLDSFRGAKHPVEPERLARAGFYSTGLQDRVTCFRCGGTIKDWQPDEDPWEEHARHYPGCSFVMEEKGPEFVTSVHLRDPKQTHSHQNGFSSHEKASNVMQSDIAHKVVEMGFDPVKVERTILEKIRRTGRGYSTADELVQDFMNDTMESESEGSKDNDDEDPLKKLDRLQREKRCKVCMDRDICVVFTPCAHLVTCEKCSECLHKCPICCREIKEKIKTYIS
ncbi:E3 ubiquitin-protein ligase XIAP [Chanos chanos]|uniref:E3 ubiquitin-protein ligase XIAP n=1 Tax=Chanos chanos TaxID=29144 RepID=A0A6J2UTI2_CHACN|nr:E3 ubiquitin-protein ligase XIAP [Chanos chanos]